jgi:type I restriction enzyme, S subunit
MFEGHARRSIGDLCDFFNGNGFRPPDWRPSGLPIIRIQNLNGSQNFNYFDGEPKPKWIVEPGDLLFAWAGVKGVSFGPTIWPGPRGVLNQHIFRIVPKKGVDKYWLYLAMQIATRRIESNAHGFKSSLVHVQKDDITNQVVDLPPLPEQRKIAEILRTWDEAIEKLEALRAAKLRRHRALTHSLVFGTRQLDRFRTSDEVAAHRWFTLPATWGIKPIGKLAREISERNGDAEQHEVLSCSKYDGFVRSLEYFKKQVFSTDLSGYKKIWRGDFGFPSNHVEEGSIGLQNLTDVGVVSPIYTVFRFASEEMDADYAFAVLKTGLYRHIFEVSTSASVDRRGSLRWSEFSKLPFPVPSLAEQKAIAEVLRTAKVDLDALSTEIEALTRQKRGLMQKLLTGEWRVNVEAN